jgi:hypothetical protein
LDALNGHGFGVWKDDLRMGQAVIDGKGIRSKSGILERNDVALWDLFGQIGE